MGLRLLEARVGAGFPAGPGSARHRHQSIRGKGWELRQRPSPRDRSIPGQVGPCCSGVLAAAVERAALHMVRRSASCAGSNYCRRGPARRHVEPLCPAQRSNAHPPLSRAPPPRDASMDRPLTLKNYRKPRFTSSWSRRRGPRRVQNFPWSESITGIRSRRWC